MTQTHTADAARATGSKSLPARIVGILFAPRATYGDVATRPRVVGAFVVVLAVIVGATFVFLSTDVGQQASLDNQIRQMESFGRPISDAQYQRMEQMAPYSRYFAAGFQLILMPIMALLVAGMAYGVFNAALGADARFKQVYAVVAHSGVILIVQSLFSLPLAYARGTMSSATNIGVFFPFLDDDTFPARLLGSIDLFLVWWFISLAIGLGVLYRRRTAPIATTLLVIYASIGLVIAAVKTATSGA